jgi:hypothetical protein
MRHKLYIWETLESTIKLIEFNNYKELMKEISLRNYPQFRRLEFLESFLSIGDERSIYAFPIVENHVKVLAWFENLNFARKEKEWFKGLKKAHGQRRLYNNKKR